ncbi:MAG: hypothetical protein V1754_10060 [Pseudomonadota bacterium]
MTRKSKRQKFQAKPANSVCGEAHSDLFPENGPKERVLHTRVPAVLEQELKRLAESLRVPVSNLVRTLLEDAVDAADYVGRKAEGELRGAAQRLSEERTKLRKLAGRAVFQTATEPPSQEPKQVNPKNAIQGIIGWQELKLALNTNCTICNRNMAVGEKAFVGVRDGAGPKTIVGQECLPPTKST